MYLEFIPTYNLVRPAPLTFHIELAKNPAIQKTLLFELIHAVYFEYIVIYNLVPSAPLLKGNLTDLICVQ